MFAVGVGADALNWTPSTWGFFVNMYSSFVAFFIGVPVALIGLDAVSKVREQTVGELQARRLTESVWRPLVNNVHKLATNDMRTLPSGAVTKFVTEWQGLTTVMSDFAHDSNAVISTEITSKIENYSDAIDAALGELLAAAGNRGVMNHRWISVRTNWEIINGLVRERRLGLELPWLQSIEESKLRFYLKSEDSPIGLLMSFYDKDASGNSFNGMRTAPRRVRALTTVTTKQAMMKQFVSLAEDLPIAFFTDASKAAPARLEGLLEVVDRIDRSQFLK